MIISIDLFVRWVGPLLLATTFSDYEDRRAESCAGLVSVAVRSVGRHDDDESVDVRCGNARQPPDANRPYGSRTVAVDAASDAIAQRDEFWWEERLNVPPRLIRISDTGVSVFCDRYGFNSAVVLCQEPAVVVRGPDGKILRSWMLSDLMGRRSLIEVDPGIRLLDCEWLVDAQPSSDGKIVWLVLDTRPIVQNPPGGMEDIRVLKLHVVNGRCESVTEKDVVSLLVHGDPAVRRLGCVAAVATTATQRQSGELKKWLNDNLVDGDLDTCVREIMELNSTQRDADELSRTSQSWLLMPGAGGADYDGVDYGVECLYPRAVCLRALMGSTPSSARVQLLSKWAEGMSSYDKTVCAVIGTWGTDRARKSVKSLDMKIAERIDEAIRAVERQTPTSNPLWD